MFQRAVLPNGLRILTCPMAHVRSATICCYVGTGSRFEPAEKAGLSHFLEHMAFKGTQTYPTPRHISEAIEGIGGVLDASTSPEVTAYWAKVPAQHFGRALDVLADMVRRPRLAPDDVEKERRVILEELHMLADSPADRVLNLINEALWPDHPLGREVAGTEAGVTGIRREDLQTYREQRYIPERIVIVVAGAISAGRAEAAIADALGDLPPHPFAPAEPAPEDVAEPSVLLEHREIEQVNLCLGVPALSYRHPERYTLLLLETILGSGMSSLLFQAVREERALAYNICTSLRQYTDSGALIVHAGVSPDRLEECLRTIWGQCQRMAAEGVTAEELARAKEYNKGRILLRMEDSYGVASWYGVQELLLGAIEEVDEVIAHLEAVQPEEIHRLAAHLFRPERVQLAVVGPFQEEATLRQALGI